RELTQHSYEEAIRRELFKPADFNLAKREETRQLAEAMGQQPAGIQRISLNGRMQLVAWSSIPQTEWHLVTVVAEENVFAQTNNLAARYKNIGYLLIAGLVLFYIGFFSVMWWRSRRLSQRLIDPIEGVSLMLEQIGQGDLRPKRVESRIVELSQAADSALKLGQQLETSEERRMHVQQRLELVLDSATEGLWEADLLDGTIAINGRFAPRFGLQGQRFTLQNFRSRVHPDDLAVLDNAMREVYRPNHDRYQAEFRFSDELGHYHWLLSRGRVLERDPNGYVRLLSGTLVDIDALKHVQDDLRQASLEAQAASQAKSRFMSSVTHELRTPLNAIQGFAQLLRLQYPQTTEPQGTDYLEEILRASQHLTQLVGDVLDWSSLPVDRPRLDFQAIPTTTLFAECAELVRNEANAQQLTLILNADPTLAVRGEQRRLRQVLLNLLSNAIKYNRPAGRVILSAEARGEQVRLQVEDTGIGMSIEQQAQLFEPFQRLGRENTAIQGTGIGLVLSRELATLMGGTLGFESEVGRGSRFWIDLPLAPLEIVAASAAGDFPMPDAAACIVFADSDTSSRELAQHAFETYPHVQMVSHSDELLALLREQSLGLLLLDQKLPGLSSAEIIRHIRQSAQNTGLPVVMLCHPEMAVEALMLDCQGLLSKPLDANELGTLVDALLKEKTANVQ
ncbi:MAG: ATP-binding protein, partial [Pseudomonas sp.]